MGFESRNKITNKDSRTAIRWVQSSLEESGIDEAQLQSELLVFHVLSCSREEYLAQPNKILTYAQSNHLKGLTSRRCNREPLAYILEEREFFNKGITVNPSVLIPRPETETLVEQALLWLTTQPKPGKRFIVTDVGTGSGCIALSLSNQTIPIQLIATDISFPAIRVARTNFQKYDESHSIQLIQSDLLSPFSFPIDLILGNLPYLPDDSILTLEPEIRDHEPLIALKGGPNGTELNLKLLAQAKILLNSPGAVILEIDPEQRKTMAHAAQILFPNGRISITKDLAGLDRVITIETL